MLTVEQLTQHNRYITGSKVASILGLHPKKSKWQLFCEMHGDIEKEQIEGIYLRMGNYAEKAFDEYIKNEGIGEIIMPPEEGRFHPKHNFLFGLIDRFVQIDGQTYVLEYKNFDKRYKSHWDTDEMGNIIIKDYILTQVYFYMILWDMPAKLLVVFGGNDPVLFDIPRNPEIEEYIIQECIQFWEDVQNHKYPEPDWVNKNTAGLLAKAYNQPVRDYISGTSVEMEVVNDFARVKSQIKELELLEAEYGNKIRALIGNHEGIIFPDGWGYIWKQNKPSIKFDKDRFVNENPEQAKGYMVTIAGDKVLRERKPKGK